MNTKSVLCGHLPTTKSVRYHPIQNITLSPSNDWSRAEINYMKPDGVIDTIFTIGNIPGKEFNIILRDTTDYKIVLCVNNNIVMTHSHLFYVEVKIYLNNDMTNYEFIKYIQDSIDDN